MRIYKPSGTYLDVVVTPDCERVTELMGDDYIKLSWSSDAFEVLPAMSYIKYESKFFYLLDSYSPSAKSEREWKYEPEFVPFEMSWEKVPFFMYSRDSESKVTGKEIDWSLTATAGYFLECIVAVLKEELNATYYYVTDAQGSQSVTFSSVDLLSALNSIADAFSTEWWIDGNVIHLTKCKREEEKQTIEVGKQAATPSISRHSEGSYNRFYAFGSTRNIVQEYKGANVNNLVNKRLTLDPDKYPNGYYQYSGGYYSKILIFEDIYPSATNLAITALLSAPKYVLDDDGNKIQTGTDTSGNPIYDTYKVWFVKLGYEKATGYEDFVFNNWLYSEDSSVHQGREGMLISGLNVSLSFSEGALMGREFELKYIEKDTKYPTTYGSATIPAGYFEILYTKDNDYIIPDTNYLIPKNGEHVVLFNIKMPDDYLKDAYTRLEAAMMAEIEEKYSADLNQYSFDLYPDVEMDLKVGSPVIFKYGDKELDTRVTAITSRIDYPQVRTITVGNEVSKGTISSLVDTTESVERDIEIIKALNNTTSNLANAYARTYQELLRAQSTFLSKVNDDTANGLITFSKGLKVGNYTSGLTGSGGSIDSSGAAELDSLSLRKFLEVPELRYNRISINVGNSWRAPGGGVIERVVPDYDSDGNLLNTGIIYLHLEDGEPGRIALDDICMGIYHDGIDLSNNSTVDTDDSIGNFRFTGFFTAYFRVTEILASDNSCFRYSIRPTSTEWPETMHPVEAMHFVVYGNFSDTDRQSSRYSTRTYERYLKGVASWEFTSEDNIAAQFGDLSNLSAFGLQMSGYSAYLNNIYMSGTIKQFLAYPLRIEIDNNGMDAMAYGETMDIKCTVYKGWDDMTDKVVTWKIARDTGNPTEDAAWALTDKAKNFAGSITIEHTESYSDLGTIGVSTLFTITATLADSQTANFSLTI